MIGGLAYFARCNGTVGFYRGLDCHDYKVYFYYLVFGMFEWTVGANFLS